MKGKEKGMNDFFFCKKKPSFVFNQHLKPWKKCVKMISVHLSCI